MSEAILLRILLITSGTSAIAIRMSLGVMMTDIGNILQDRGIRNDLLQEGHPLVGVALQHLIHAAAAVRHYRPLDPARNPTVKASRVQRGQEVGVRSIGFSVLAEPPDTRKPHFEKNPAHVVGRVIAGPWTQALSEPKGYPCRGVQFRACLDAHDAYEHDYPNTLVQ